MDVPDDLLNVLEELEMPIIKDVPRHLLDLIIGIEMSYIPFVPSTTRQWLRAKLAQPPIRMTPAMATILLRYVISDKSYRDVYDLPLFYCRDGERRAIGLRKENLPELDDVLYLGSQEVVDLFDDIRGQFIDLEALAQDLRIQLKQDIGTISKVLALQRFGIEAFHAYAATRVGWHPLTEEVELPLENFDLKYSWLQKLWNWLNKYETKSVAKVVKGLFLIPLQSGRVRKVCNRINQLKSVD
jgi:hypothetical protein